MGPVNYGAPPPRMPTVEETNLVLLLWRSDELRKKAWQMLESGTAVPVFLGRTTTQRRTRRWRNGLVHQRSLRTKPGGRVWMMLLSSTSAQIGSTSTRSCPRLRVRWAVPGTSDIRHRKSWICHEHSSRLALLRQSRMSLSVAGGSVWLDRSWSGRPPPHSGSSLYFGGRSNSLRDWLRASGLCGWEAKCYLGDSRRRVDDHWCNHGLGPVESAPGVLGGRQRHYRGEVPRHGGFGKGVVSIERGWHDRFLICVWLSLAGMSIMYRAYHVPGHLYTPASESGRCMYSCLGLSTR